MRDSHLSYPDQANDFCFQVEEDSFWFNYRNAFIVEAVRRFPPSGPIADVGAGNGYVSLALQRAGFPTIVIEPGPAGARNARSRGLDPVICATLQGAGLASHSLHGIGLFDVLEHIEDDRTFLADVHRFLTPGGRLYLTVPAFRTLWSSEDDLAGHYHRYTLKLVKNRLREAGFAVNFATYVFSPLVAPLFLLRTVPSRLGRRQSQDVKQIAAELQPSPGLLVTAVTTVLDGELALLKRGWRIPFGTSCLAVATSS